jgi:GTP-binding protein HflX
VLEALAQRRAHPDAATFIGSGKVEELREVVDANGADTVIVDGELSASQLRNLEDKVGVKVVDRTMLILDIFAQHAKSREGKAQVELAQLEYLSQRLRGWGASLSRQAGGRAGGAGGGVGTRGPGETKLETDRRRIRTRVAKLRRDLADMRTARDTKRADRRRHAVPAVSIVGYTNAGKSSLLNRLTGAGVLVEDALFATLDPTVRRSQTQEGRVYTIADTVGFVRHLPHELVESFRSTLEEAGDADLLVHVVDGSHPDPEGQLTAVRAVLADIGAGGVREVVAVNKSDAADPMVVARLLRSEPHAVAVSARTGAGVDKLRALIESELPQPPVEVDALVPYDHGELVARVHTVGEVLSVDHEADGTRVRARVPEALAAALEPYAVAPR